MLRAPALVAGAVLAAAGCGSSEQQPVVTGARAVATQDAARPGPAARGRIFRSQPYAFRVTLTRRWSETDASMPWTGDKLEGLDSPAFANFMDPATDRNLAVAAARVGRATRVSQWRATMVRAAPDGCSESRSAVKTTLGGERALTWTATCVDGYDVHKLAVLHGGRGYMLLLASRTANDDAVDGRIFDAMRRSFRFTGA